MVSGGGFSEDELGVKWGVGSGVGITEGAGIGVGDGVGDRIGFGVGAAVGASAGTCVGGGVGAGVGTGVGAGVGWGRTARGGGGSDGAVIVGWGAVVGVAIRTWVFGVGGVAGAASSVLAGKHATNNSAAANSGRMTPTVRPDQRLRPFANLSNLPIVSY